MKKPSRAITLLAFTALFEIEFACPAGAQVLPPASSVAAAGESESVVELSPFTVTVGKNTGYQAVNTLAGTRLNSNLEDLAASITVVTKQQLLDTAAVDINDIFLYEANTEGAGQFTNFSVNQGIVLDNVQTSPQTANRIRGLTAANIARGNFGSTSSIPIDTYNVDAIEISRGPNSSIFGLGDAAGSVNVITSKALLDRSRSSFTTRVDDRGGYRGTFDFNRPLVPGIFSARVQGMAEDKGFTRKPSRDKTNRLQVSIAARPFKQTTLTAGYESYHNFNRRPNSLTPGDTVTEWRGYGSPTWDPITFRAQVNGVYTAPIPVGSNQTSENIVLPPGLFSDGNRLARPTMFIDNGMVQLYTNGRVPLSTAATRNDTPGQNNADPIRYIFSGSLIGRGGAIYGLPPLPLYNEIGVSDQSIYDWENINVVASNWGNQKADTYHAELEHFFVNNGTHLLAAQLGWFREDSDSLSRNFFGQTGGHASIVYIDVNERQLDGTPNAFFLRPFIGGFQPATIRKPEENDNFRAVLAYQLDLSDRKAWQRHLGRHRLSGFKEYRKITDVPTGLRSRELVTSDHPWLTNATREAAQALVYPRYYLGGPVNQPGPGVDYAPTGLRSTSGEFDLYWYRTATRSWATEKVSIAEVYVSGQPAQRAIRTTGFNYQGFFLNDRFIPTFGLRKDTQSSRQSIGGELDPATGYKNYSTVFELWEPWTEQGGTTRTAGVVVKPLSWLHAHYNESDSFRPAQVAFNIFGEQLPNPSGEGRDYGLTLNLLKGKLVVRFNQYETLENDKRGTIGTIVNRARDLDSDANAGGRPDLEQWLAREVALWQPAWSAAQQRAEVLKRMGVEEGFHDLSRSRVLSDVNNATSKGKEIELFYNPDAYLTIKANLTQQRALDTDLSPNLQQFIDQRLATWTTAASPVDGRLWWTDNNNAARNFYEASVLADLKLAVTTAGKPKPQTREWRANVVARYRLAGLKKESWLRNTTIGGAIRWEDKGAIGFFGGAPDADGAVRELDGNKPIFDQARSYCDLMLGYQLRLFKDKVRTDLQLNIRDVFENGRLQAVGVNPDGRPYSFRIIDPRQVILTASFEL